MTGSKRLGRRLGLAGAAILALMLAMMPLQRAKADDWHHHYGWNGYGRGWYGGPSFSFYGGPGYYYAPPPPAYYYAPPPGYYPSPPVYYTPPPTYYPYAMPFFSFGFTFHGH